MKYSPSFQFYLDKQFRPAQQWALSNEGINWIAEHIPSLANFIDTRYNECICGVYLIRLNDTPMYVGESIRAVRRLCVHAWHLSTKPELFGLIHEDVRSAYITVEFLAENLYETNLRKAEEKYYRDKPRPLLQNTEGSDICLPRSERRAAIQSALGFV